MYYACIIIVASNKISFPFVPYYMGAAAGSQWQRNWCERRRRFTERASTVAKWPLTARPIYILTLQITIIVFEQQHSWCRLIESFIAHRLISGHKPCDFQAKYIFPATASFGMSNTHINIVNGYLLNYWSPEILRSWDPYWQHDTSCRNVRTITRKWWWRSRYCW